MPRVSAIVIGRDAGRQRLEVEAEVAVLIAWVLEARVPIGRSPMSTVPLLVTVRTASSVVEPLDSFGTPKIQTRPVGTSQSENRCRSFLRRSTSLACGFVVGQDNLVR